jgi:hypothetical protein
MAGAFDVLSVAGIVIVGLLMALYLVVVSRTGRAKQGGATPAPAVGGRPRDL